MGDWYESRNENEDNCVGYLTITYVKRDVDHDGDCSDAGSDSGEEENFLLTKNLTVDDMVKIVPYTKESGQVDIDFLRGMFPETSIPHGHCKYEGYAKVISGFISIKGDSIQDRMRQTIFRETGKV